MSTLNVPIKIKRGTGVPANGSLKRGELAYSEDLNRLYIGTGDEVGGFAPNVEELLTPATVLEDLADVSISSGPNDGDVLTYDDATGGWIAQAVAAASVAWADVTGKPSVFAPDTHTHAWGDITSGVPATFTPSAHKASHATGGADAIAPADIGAAPASHTHAASDITSGLATVATTGAYSDLSGTPTLGTAAASATTDFVAASAASTFGLSLIDDADAAAARTTLGLGSAATLASTAFADTDHSHDWTDITSGVPSTFTPSSHTHGSISNDGKIGTTAGHLVKTGSDGTLTTLGLGFTDQYLKTGVSGPEWASLPSTFTPSAHSHTVTLEMSGFIEAPEAKTYVLSPSIPAAITITNIKAQTGSGTCDLKLQDDGADIANTTLDDVGSGSVASPGTAPGASVAAGSKLALVVSDPSSSAPEDLAFTVYYTVTSADNAS